MDDARINFAELPWDESNAGVRSKVVVRNHKRVRLVEFTSEFVESDWCVKGHVGYVLGGEMEVVFHDRIERFASGDGILIAGGESERHKATVVGQMVRLILVEDDSLNV
jgi:hypothetical protein